MIIGCDRSVIFDMNESLYKKTEQFVIDSFIVADKPTDVIHAQRTAYWVGQLKNDPDEALLMAAVAHDIERAFYGDWKKGSSDVDALRKHQDLSARTIGTFLKKEGASDAVIERVKHLVEHHEEGGDDDQNVLCDADCLAYFEEKALRHANEAKQQGRSIEMKERLHYVFDRVTSPKAREIARQFYDKAMDALS